MRLPSLVDNEIHQMARIEALKQIPYGEEEIVESSRIIEKGADGYSFVFLSSALRNTVDRYMQWVRHAGFYPTKVVLTSEGIYEWVKDSRRDLSEKNLLVACVDNFYLDIIVIEHGNLAFARGLPLSVTTSLEERYLVEGVLISAETYQSQSGQKLDEVLVYDCRKNSGSLTETLAQKMTASVSVLSLPAAITSKAPQGASVLGLLGIAKYPQDIQINLVPQNIADENQLVALAEDLKLFFVVTLITATLLLLILLKQQWSAEWIIKQIDEKNKVIQKQVKAAKANMQNFESISPQDTLLSAQEALSQVVLLTDASIKIQYFDYELGVGFVIRGEAPSLTAVLDYAQGLDDSKKFHNVKVRYTNTRMSDQGSVVAFEISIGDQDELDEE